MHTLPTEMIRVLTPFAPLFSKRVFEHAQALVAGAIPAPGKRTVSSALRATGLGKQKTFHRYHRVLSRAVWSSREAGRILLESLVEAFVPEGAPLVVGMDETLERRQGKKIAAKGILRDPCPRFALLREATRSSARFALSRAASRQKRKAECRLAEMRGSREVHSSRNSLSGKIHAVMPRGFELKIVCFRLLPFGLLHPMPVGGNSG